MIKGKQSIAFEVSPYLEESASVVGKKEGEGPLGGMFDIAKDGIIPESVKERLKKLSGIYEIYVLTADTHGTARKICEGLPLKIQTFPGNAAAEEKRKIIGKVFIDVFEREAAKTDAKYLVQGTIAPDWIESKGKIKSHHNLALPSGMVLDLVEPIRDLYKDEVREIGLLLDLPEKVVHRQPFPGPGLAVRVIGELTHEKLDICRKANKIVTDEIEKAGIDKDVWQYFAVLTDSKVTGVKGDQRDFGYLVVLRIVDSIDAMTAYVPELPWNVIQTMSQRITSEISEVTHVALSISDKPPSTIEFA